MSINKVEVTNSQGNLLALSLEDISNGFVVEDINGLGPVKASIATSNFATMDGQQRQGSSREVRNVTIKLSYAPDYSENQTIRTLRSRLYQFFMTATMVDLAFYMTDGMTVNVTGEVEGCEPSIFTAEPQMDISILCFNPDFVDLTPVSLTGFTTIDSTPHDVLVNGTVKTGLTSLSFTAPKALSEFTIYHKTPANVMHTMLVSAPLLLNDVVNLNTVKGEKSITMTRVGVTTSLQWAVSPESTWVLLEPGMNELHLNASSTGPSAPVVVTYNNRYGGL